MPPFLPRKRSGSPPSPRKPPAKKARLSDVLDAGATNAADAGKKLKRSFTMGDESDASSSLSEVDSDEFEDVTTVEKSARSGPGRRGKDDDEEQDENEEEDNDDEDDGIEWEDTTVDHHTHKPAVPMLANGSIELTFRKDDDDDAVNYSTAMQNVKKGPSRREKQVRLTAHQLHVQLLLGHNAIRNTWASDKIVQETLVKQLPQQILLEIDKWKRASGIWPDEKTNKQHPDGKAGKAKKQGKKQKQHRDWGSTSQPLEIGKPDMSHGDPLISLMRVLAAYWKKKFAITAPGLRKRGYHGTKQALKKEIQSYRNDEHDPERHGEKIPDLNHFRELAKSCEGSRDVGAQLFTALVRALGLEARLVASLQPTGYGWTKAEQKVTSKSLASTVRSTKTTPKSGRGKKPLTQTKSMNGAPTKRLAKSKRTEVVNLDTDGDDEQSESHDSDESSDDDDSSVVDVTVRMPKQRPQKYDRELAFPIYWTEVVSPITNKVLPVSPLVIENAVAATPESLAQFEPRGAKADKAQQVMAYVVAHSPDGTAKDVTVRYLRKRLWPGKTKGFRYPVQKVPFYDRRGKVVQQEEFDWFSYIMNFRARSPNQRTAVDDIEDATDLMPAKPDKKEDAGVDTLQSLKSSSDFVLERFLRREEALRPDAEPVRVFASGKGNNVKEEPVYSRADVERCLTAESWHKEGRRPKLGETAMKFVPVRAVTLTRKREAEEHERVTGQKQMQGLYAWDQTEWIIPAPIEDGVIPKNSYGNMDCFVPSMVPKGAVHLPLKGSVKICKKLGIDYAEAVTGFEFGNKRAVPVCTGVVVAEENKELVTSAWNAHAKEEQEKAWQKLEAIVLDTWKKFTIGMRIRQRVVEEYGEPLQSGQQATGLHEHDAIAVDDDDDEDGMSVFDEAGGFLPDDGDEEAGGGFLLAHEDDVSDAGELVVEHEPEADLADTMMIPSQTFELLPTIAEESSDMEIDDPPQLHTHVPATNAGRKKREKGQGRSKQAAAGKVKNTTKNARSGKETSDAGSTSDDDNADDEFETELQDLDLDDDDFQSETYTPRATRRPRQATLQKATPTQTPEPADNDSTRGRGTGKKVKNPAVTPKKRGRPRKSDAEKPDRTDGATKKSTRSSSAKKQNATSLKSPYFGSSE